MPDIANAAQQARPPASLRRALVGAGRVYVGYNALVMALLVYEAVSTYSGLAEFLGAVIVGFVFYPVLLPAFTMCGGMHGGGCKSALGAGIQLTVLGLTVAWSVTGWWVAISVCQRWIRRRRGAETAR